MIAVAVVLALASGFAWASVCRPVRWADVPGVLTNVALAVPVGLGGHGLLYLLLTMAGASSRTVIVLADVALLAAGVVLAWRRRQPRTDVAQQPERSSYLGWALVAAAISGCLSLRRLIPQPASRTAVRTRATWTCQLTADHACAHLPRAHIGAPLPGETGRFPCGGRYGSRTRDSQFLRLVLCH